jgi:glutaredoxin
MNALERSRRIALYVALVLALTLLALDRTAAYLHRPAADSKAVVIYTTVWCPYCRQLRSFLDANHIPYTDYDVERSFSGGIGMWALRGRNVPVVVVGADVIHGLDIAKLRESLARLGYDTVAPRGGNPGGSPLPAGAAATRL